MWIVLRAAVFLLLLVWSEPVFSQDDPDDPAVVSFRNGAFAEALHAWMEAAARGDAQAARYLGVLYDTGEGVQQDQTLALLWYRRAAELGDASAMFNVAVCYDAGRGTARDLAAAAQWYARAAAVRYGRAEYNLGLMYESGDGIPQDRRAAVRLFRAASRDGITAARTRLRGLHAAVLAVPSVMSNDQADAVFASAQRALLRRTQLAAATAAALFARVASVTGPTGTMARYDLAWCYENGIGVQEDRQRASALFASVAAQTTDPGLHDLAQAGADASARLHVTVSEGAPSTSPPAAPEKPGGSPGGQPD